MDIVIYTLSCYINSNIVHDTNYGIARCLLLNIRKLSRLSLEETADLCNVSPSTLKRFCKTVGFNNFSTIKRLLRNPSLPFDYDSFISNVGKSEYVDKLYNCLKNIEKIPKEYFDKITRLIDNAEHIYLLGYGDYYYEAEYLQNIMLYHGKLLEIINQNDELRNSIHVNENDLIIVTSLTGAYARRGHNNLNKMKCRKVLIIMKDTGEFSEFNPILEIGYNNDKNINKYLIMRVYEKIISNYYSFKRGQNMTSK